MKRRKPRSDCNYIIYEMTSECGSNYVGLTRKTESTPLRSIKRRWSKHISRAKKDDLQWKLYEFIRSREDMKWKHTILEVVRGRSLAYKREREIILEMKPLLNTQYNKKEEE
jgi:hypothetical protein